MPSIPCCASHVFPHRQVRALTASSREGSLTGHGDFTDVSRVCEDDVILSEGGPQSDD